MAATSAISPPSRGDGLVTVTQHGFVVKEGTASGVALGATPRTSAGDGIVASAWPVAAAVAATAPLSPRSKSRSAAALGGTAEPGLLSLGVTPRRGGAAPPLQTLPTSGALDDDHTTPGTASGELRLAQCATLTTGAKRLLRDVARGLKAWQEPEAAPEGFGGTYFFRDEAGRRCAIMKPCDEEPLAPNNPKGFVGRKLGDPGLKPTVRVGEAATREVAAYLLDRGHFSKVPHTVMVEMSHPVFHVAAPTPTGEDSGTSDAVSTQPSGGSVPGGATSLLTAVLPAAGRASVSVSTPASTTARKLGSLQAFVPHDGDCSEMGASRFPVRDVHRIGILDIRLFNTDRHSGNILVRKVRRSQGGSGESAGVAAGGNTSGGTSGAAPGPGVTTAAPTPSPLLLDRRDWVYELVPIDHGFALPEALEPPYFEWQHWPQAMMPFGPEELEYIAGLDARADAAMLRTELPGLREESLRLLEVATLVLQRGAAAGLSLAEIAGVLTRPLVGLDEEASELERACTAARREVELARARRRAFMARAAASSKLRSTTGGAADGAESNNEIDDDDDADSVLGAYYDEFAGEFDEDDVEGIDEENGVTFEAPARRSSVTNITTPLPPPASTFEALLRRHGEAGPPLFMAPDSPALTTAASSRTPSTASVRTPSTADSLRVRPLGVAAPRSAGLAASGLFAMDEEGTGSGPSGGATPVAMPGSPFVLTPRTSLETPVGGVGVGLPALDSASVGLPTNNNSKLGPATLVSTPVDLRRLVISQRESVSRGSMAVAAASGIPAGVAAAKRLPPATPVGVASSAAAAAFGTPADGSVDSSGGSGAGAGMALAFGLAHTPTASPQPVTLQPGAASCVPAVGFFDRVGARGAAATGARRRRRPQASARLCAAPTHHRAAAIQAESSATDSLGDGSPVGEDAEAVDDFSASAVFQGLSTAEWDHFMHALRDYVNNALRSGAWKQAPGSSGKGLPGMSCPRF